MNARRMSRTSWAVAVLAMTLSFAPAAEAGFVLYASDTVTHQLFTLDPTNASATLVGGFGVASGMHGLAYDATDNILFGSDAVGNTLYRIDRSTGAATLIGPLGVSLIQALAFDTTTGRLYGAYGGASLSLYQINPATGAATPIGGLGFSMSGLSFDPVTHVLYGSSTDINNLGVYTIDPATGKIIAKVSSTGFNGISFDPTTDRLYGVSNGGNAIFGGPAEGLYTIATQSGAVSLVGSLSLSNPLDIQFALAPQTVPEPGSLALAGLGITLLIGTSIVRRRPAGPTAERDRSDSLAR